MVAGPRFAIYFVPAAASALYRFGAAVLGYDCYTGEPVARPREIGLTDAAWAALTAEPRTYGFHATLKAPFRLAAGKSLHDLRHAVAALAARHRDFEMPPLEVAWLHDFVALRPVPALDSAHPLRQLADACVSELDAFRAPAPPGEQARRAAEIDGDVSGLAMLARWGYAHVFEGWRFHMTLSDRFDDRSSPEARQFEHDARAWFSRSLAQPLHGTALSIFHEASAGDPFRMTERFPLGSPA